MTDVQDFADEIKTLKDTVLDRVVKAESDIRILKQKNYRLSASAADAPPPPAAMLQASKELQGWLHSARGKKSSISIEFPFEMKAVTVDVGGITHYPGVTGPQQPALRLVELLPTIPISSGGSIEYTREIAFTPGAAVVAEGTVKPGSVVAFENTLAMIRTVATISKVSLQSISDVPGLQTWLDTRLRYAVLLAAEDLFLNSAAPDGLLASAVALAPAFTPGATGSTGLDTIAGMVSQLQAGGYEPDGVILSGADAYALRVLKTSTGEYLWSTPDAGLGVNGIWGVRPIISPSIVPGTVLVGAFQQSTIVFSRQLLVVEIAFENEDDFTRNLCTLRAEQRVALAIATPQGLVKATLPATVATATRAPAPASHK